MQRFLTREHGDGASIGGAGVSGRDGGGSGWASDGGFFPLAMNTIRGKELAGALKGLYGDHGKGGRGQAALDALDVFLNRIKSKVRAIVEHPFGWMKSLMHDGRTRMMAGERGIFGNEPGCVTRESTRKSGRSRG